MYYGKWGLLRDDEKENTLSLLGRRGSNLKLGAEFAQDSEELAAARRLAMMSGQY